MSIRYLHNLATGLAAGFLVVATLVFSPIVASWLTFAIAAGITVAALATIALPATGLVQRTLSGVTVALGAWTIVASLVFAPVTAAVLGFASALAFVGLAVAGLTAHELTAERVVHSFEVTQSQASDRRPEPVVA